MVELFLWNHNEERKMSISDGKFEVVAITSAVHLGNVQTGVGSPVIVGQGSKIKIKLNKKVPVQIDGEPWRQEPCTIEINHLNKVKMLVNRDECHSVVKESIIKQK